jgi:hypothetical protein
LGDCFSLKKAKRKKIAQLAKSTPNLVTLLPTPALFMANFHFETILLKQEKKRALASNLIKPEYFFLYTLAGFDLTTHNYAGGDKTMPQSKCNLLHPTSS